ncbi:hypothetical protein [Demetria terragena]|uniref:hypothetical protein n=1 Tax=Demetria terragena TaxID=63959 RepID=UPI00037A8286|nr:hypothetical protein [Demetria terragena]
MTTITKLGAFVAGLALVLAAAFGLGRFVGPLGEPQAQAASHHGGEQQSAPGQDRTTTPAPGGLQVSEHGYTLVLDRPIRASGEGELSFQILGPDGKPVTDYRRQHDKDLHLIVVRRDLSGFQHVHPTRDASGRWSVGVRLSPGTWRVFADFMPSGRGESMTLGADLEVAGTTGPQPIPGPSRTTTVDGYTVTLKGDLKPNQGRKLVLSVAQNGRPVTNLEPYLGAYGHLVALRDGDLAYLHVHPDGEPGDGSTKPGPGIAFHTTAPSVGTYRFFLDFKHDGVVRTAEFTVRAGGAATPPESEPAHADTDHTH